MSTLAKISFTGIHYSRTGRPTGDRYRYISDEEAHFGERYRYIDDNTYKIVNGRYRGERTQLSKIHDC